MVSTSSSSSSGSVSSSNVNDLDTHQPLTGADPTGAVSDNNSRDTAAPSTPLLVGIIAASVIVFMAILFVIRSRRRRYEPKLFSPSSISAFHGVTSTTALEHSSNALWSSIASTAMTSPQPPLLQTFRLPRLKEAAGDEVAIDIHDVRNNELPPERTTQASLPTSLVSRWSVLSASILMRGGSRSSIPSLAAFRASRADRNSGVDTTDSSASTVSFANSASTAPHSNGTHELPPVEQRRTEGDAWRDLSDTCWSIGPGSDSETESEQFTLPTASHAPAGALVLSRNRLSTLSDDIGDIEEESTQQELDVNSLDDSSRRRDLVMNSLDDLSPRRERGISALNDSSPRRVRGLSALESRRKANSVADTDTNKSGASYFSVDSDYYYYYYDMIKDCSSVLSEDSESDSDSDSDSDESVREEEF